jgi:hypothetical protein
MSAAKAGITGKLAITRVPRIDLILIPNLHKVSGDGQTRDSTVSGHLISIRLRLDDISESLLSHSRLDALRHPWIEAKGMTTMRLHRLHFSSKLWPLTFAINWPHSQRVSDGSAIACEGPVIIETMS